MLVKGHFECYLCDITQPQIMKKDEKISGKFTELVQKEYENEEELERKVLDYISGMTDSYAITKFKEIYLP